MMSAARQRARLHHLLEHDCTTCWSTANIGAERVLDLQRAQCRHSVSVN